MAPSISLDDPRLAAASWESEGDAQEALAALQPRFQQLGLVGVIAGGFENAGVATRWIVSGGFANPQTVEELQPGRAMLAGSITKLLTATLVLRLVGEDQVALDHSANHFLSSVRLASDRVMVRHLLNHTSGASSVFEHFVDEVPPTPEILGKEVAVEFAPGTEHRYSNAGYALLGELIAQVRDLPYHEVVERELFMPLGMNDSEILRRWPPDAPCGYVLRDRRLVLVDRKVPSVPAAGGLYTTVADLGCFLAGWRSLLPADLAAAAISAQATVRSGGWQGYGWRISKDTGDTVVGHGGGVLGFRGSLMWNMDTDRASVVLVNSESDGVEDLGRLVLVTT